MFAKRDLTQGSIPRGLLGFALPLILGNLLQQLYNLADTWVVGRFIGEGALAAVGSSYTLMTFLTSILLGLCMGSSVYFSIQYGRQDPDRRAKWDFSVLSAHRRADAPAQPHRLSGPGRDSGPPADPTGYFGSDKGIPAVDLRRHGRHLSVQFFCQSSPLRGGLRHPAGLFGDFRGSEHRPGHPLCGALGHGGSGAPWPR